MGYQLIEGKLISEQTTMKYIVYTCELAVDFDEQFQTNRRQIIDKGFSNILNEARSLLVYSDSIKLVSRSMLFESRAI